MAVLGAAIHGLRDRNHTELLSVCRQGLLLADYPRLTHLDVMAAISYGAKMLPERILAGTAGTCRVNDDQAG